MIQMNITHDHIENLSYTDFIGLINQWNVLPGAFSTLSKWCTFSRINENSSILEVACTTGFSSREIASMYKCRALGLDISKSSVEKAIYNAKKSSLDNKVSYFHADLHDFEIKEKFSHVIIGASLKFFPDPINALNKCLTLVENNGYILASPFYTTSRIPDELVYKAKQIFGITPTVESYKEIMSAYRGLDIIYEDRCLIEQETEEEINLYCESTVNRFLNESHMNNDLIYDSAFNRLKKIKLMSNSLRPYQGYSVLVLKYNSDIYPERYVELF